MTSPTYNPHHVWPQFYSNPTIAALGNNRRWTVSTQQDVRADPNDPTSKVITPKKMPIDIQELRSSGRVMGARVADAEQTLMTLPELTHFLPNASNCAYYLDWTRDNVITLDIESTCPPDVRDRLLTVTPYALYTEVSMSGRGYHLVLPMPPAEIIDPAVSMKRVLRNLDGHYEILLDHWVTFTRTPIDPGVINHAFNTAERITPLTLWQELVTEATSLKSGAQLYSVGIGDELGLSADPEQARYEQNIINRAHNAALAMPSSDKTPADFNFDNSRYEFSVLSRIAHAVGRELYGDILEDYGSIDPANMPEGAALDQIARLTYVLGTHVIEYRDKHDQTRNGLPYLAQRAVDVVEHIDWDEFNAKLRTRYIHGQDL